MKYHFGRAYLKVSLASFFCCLSPLIALAQESLIVDSQQPPIFQALSQYQQKTKEALQANPPVLNLLDLSDDAKKALALALEDNTLRQKLSDPITKVPYRNEVFTARPVRAGDGADSDSQCANKICWSFEIFNFTRHSSLRAVVNLTDAKLIGIKEFKTLLPEIPTHLEKLAIEIASRTPEVQKQLGLKPNPDNFVMAGTKTALNRSRCERSEHLCVAPTFVVGKRALWSIVDLVEGRVVGTRFTEWSENAPIAFTEDRIRDEHILRELCQKSSSYSRDGWTFQYHLTSSDGLDISQLRYKGKLLLQSFKNADWHVSYSDKDGFGYSDAVGCPLFSAAAVVPATLPKTKELTWANWPAGFEFHIDFLSKLWPLPCNYYYEQRLQLFSNGTFRPAVANVGRGCGEPGMYRPVMRLELPFDSAYFDVWNGASWDTWTHEKWEVINKDTAVTVEGYRYRVRNADGSGYYLAPGRGQFGDKGRGDNAWTYVVLNKGLDEEGKADLPTLGPCCNTNHEQGPEKFIGPNPEQIAGKKLTLWYVPQMQNESKAGSEYCWGNTVIKDGKVEKLEYPCVAGPLFVPFEKP
jgi:hypothetical protein